MWSHKRYAARTDLRSRAINVAFEFSVVAELRGPAWWRMKLAQALPKTGGSPAVHDPIDTVEL